MVQPGELTAKLSIGIGFVLVGVGVVSYVLSEFASVTALIPAVFGILFVFLGRMHLHMDRERLAVYGLGVLSLLGLGGTVRSIGDVMTLATGGTVDEPIAIASQGVMALFCLIILGMAISFVVNDHRSTSHKS